MKVTLKSIVFLLLLFVTGQFSYAQDKRPDVFDHKDFFAPTVVADIPGDAAGGFCLTANGRIRHYSYIMTSEGNINVYIESDDNGRSWTLHEMESSEVGPMLKSSFSRYWVGFDSGVNPTVLLRSKSGPGDKKAIRTELPWTDEAAMMQIIALKSRKRFVAVFSTEVLSAKNGYHAAVAYSDDDGVTWTKIPLQQASFIPRMTLGDKRPHWYNNGCEPTIAELSDGTLLIAARTSGPYHTFYKSEDGGETWSAPYEDRNFWACNTRPKLLTLNDGRLLFVWNNTSILPTLEVEKTPEMSEGEKNGVWESVFTNRDALHAAISDDGGKTWHGFREIALNSIRNEGDFRQIGGWPRNGHDRSVHETCLMELPDGKVMVAYGQERASSRILIFDPDWLYETSAEEDFRSGFEHISNHLYVRTLTGGRKGWAGHCAWNRVPGALLVIDPDVDSSTQKDVLQLCRISDPRLVSDRQGVVWNFPASRKGRFETECRIDGEGFQLALCDHWINPCDEFGPKASPVVFHVDRNDLPDSKWYKLNVEWDLDSAQAILSVDGNPIRHITIDNLSPSGLSYVHLQTLAENSDPLGTYFRYFKKN